MKLSMFIVAYTRNFTDVNYFHLLKLLWPPFVMPYYYVLNIFLFAEP